MSLKLQKLFWTYSLCPFYQTYSDLIFYFISISLISHVFNMKVCLSKNVSSWGNNFLSHISFFESSWKHDNDVILDYLLGDMSVAWKGHKSCCKKYNYLTQNKLFFGEWINLWFTISEYHWKIWWMGKNKEEEISLIALLWSMQKTVAAEMQSEK